MKSRLIKFACHGCGTKLAVPPEMAGVSDHCPKCGATITAPATSTLEAPKKKKASSASKKKASAASPPASEAWTASDLLDAINPPPASPPVSLPPPVELPPPAPVPVQDPSPVPAKASPASKTVDIPAEEYTPLTDPPADPAHFMAPRPRPEEKRTVATPPAPVSEGKPSHAILGSILNAPVVAKASSGKLKTLSTPFPPAPVKEENRTEDPPASADPAPAPKSPATTSPPPATAEKKETSPPPAEAPPKIGKPESKKDEPAPASSSATPPSSDRPEQSSTAAAPATALVPQSLPDHRAAAEAAMPGMGEVLAGHALQEGNLASEPRDHRPLLHVPFLPVAESPSKERKALKRKLYIIGAVLFVVLDIIVAIWFFTRPPGSLSGGEGNGAAAEDASSRDPGSPASGSEDVASAPSTPAPTLSAPSDFPTAPADPAVDPPKPSKPPMAIPLPGHVATDVPTALPVDPKSPSPASAPTADSAAPTPSSTGRAGSDAPGTSGAYVSPTPQAAPAPPVVAESKPSPAPAMEPVTPPPPVAPAAPDATSTPAPAPAAPTPEPDSRPMVTNDGPLPLPTFELPPGATEPLPTPQLGPAPIAPVPIPSSPPPPAPPAPVAMSPTAGLLPEEITSTAPQTPARVGKVPATAQSALESLQSFLAAANWQERAAFVQRADQVRPAMEKHALAYGDGPIYPASIDFVEHYPGKEGAPPYSMFELDGGSLKHRVLVLVDQPPKAKPLIDWECFVEFKDDLLLKFLTTQGAPDQSFRVLIRRKHYFDKDVPDLAGKDSFQVEQPNAQYDGHVFLPKGSALSKKLASQLGWGQDMLMLVELTWKNNEKTHWVELSRIVSYGWRG